MLGRADESLLAAERRWRLGPHHTQRSAEYLCDLQCGVLRERCPWRRLDVAYIVDSFLWLSGALSSIASLIETGAGECATLGAWRFHLIVSSEGGLNQTASRLLSRGGPLTAAIELHTFHDPRSPSPLKFATTESVKRSNLNLTWQQRAERHRLLRPANFARFDLPSLLPPSVRFVLYMDSDVFGIHGPVAPGPPLAGNATGSSSIKGTCVPVHVIRLAHSSNGCTAILCALHPVH